MAWRLARSLEVLRDEIEQVAPGTTVWTIGDEDHQDDWSDHNPNECCDVVCAADILSNAGLDLAWLVATITATDPLALKYVIYRDRIWFPQTGWQPYRGAFHSHVHVSVGWGPDGRSTGPYDDTAPWGLTEEADMPINKADAHILWGSDGAVASPTLHVDGSRRTAAQIAANPRWAGASFVRDTYDNVARLRRAATELAAGQAAILAAVGGQDVTAAVRAELDRAAAAERAERQAELAGLRDGLGEALLAELGPALAAELTEVPAERIEAALAKLRLVVDEG